METEVKIQKARLLEHLIGTYPGGVPRSLVKKATGGIVAPKTLANHDAMGTGPANSFKARGKTLYHPESLASWIFGDDEEKA